VVGVVRGRDRRAVPLFAAARFSGVLRLVLLELLHLPDVLLRVALELPLAVVAAEADQLLLILDRLGRVDVFPGEGTDLIDGIAVEGDLLARNRDECHRQHQSRQRELVHPDPLQAKTSPYLFHDYLPLWVSWQALQFVAAFSLS